MPTDNAHYNDAAVAGKVLSDGLPWSELALRTLVGLPVGVDGDAQQKEQPDKEGIERMRHFLSSVAAVTI
jgi:hypothetical protein